VVNGIQTFVPRMIAARAGGHIVNTASVAGFQGTSMAGIYCASKFAVRGLSEALRDALTRYEIGVSILCPASVNTDIAHSVLTRPSHLGGYEVSQQMAEALRALYARGMDPLVLAEHVKAGVERNDPYIIPYPEERQNLAQHFERILQAIPPESSDIDGAVSRRSAMAEYIETRKRLMPASAGRN